MLFLPSVGYVLIAQADVEMKYKLGAQGCL